MSDLLESQVGVKLVTSVQKWSSLTPEHTDTQIVGKFNSNAFIQLNYIFLKKIKAMFRFLRNEIASFSVAGIYCKLQDSKVHKRNNKGKCNVPLFNDL